MKLVGEGQRNNKLVQKKWFKWSRKHILSQEND